MKPLSKARSSQHRVALYKYAKVCTHFFWFGFIYKDISPNNLQNFLQLHAEIQALSKEEISLSLIKAKLCSTF